MLFYFWCTCWHRNVKKRKKLPPQCVTCNLYNHILSWLIISRSISFSLQLRWLFQHFLTVAGWMAAQHATHSVLCVTIVLSSLTEDNHNHSCLSTVRFIHKQWCQQQNKYFTDAFYCLAKTKKGVHMKSRAVLLSSLGSWAKTNSTVEKEQVDYFHED